MNSNVIYFPTPPPPSHYPINDKQNEQNEKMLVFVFSSKK